MTAANYLLRAAGSSAEKLYVDDVFTSWVRTGTGADVTITTGIDMTQGYMLWTKGRSGATDHALYHSARGVTLDLATNTTAAQTTQTTGLKSVSSTGHTIGSLAKMNTSSATYVDWVVRNADKFYNHGVVTKSAGSNATVSFPGLTTLGMVRVKRTDSTGSWYIWHRSLSAGQLLIGETTAAAATLGHVTVSGTTVTLVNGVIADGTYLVEGFAHDDSADGIIQCGSFTTDASGNATVNLGWEPQYLLVKITSTTNNWLIFDQMRGWNMDVADARLSSNLSNAEVAASNGNPNASGFDFSFVASNSYIYLAIRRPNKPPTTGTEVYNAIARTGTGAVATVTAGFAPDLTLIRSREVVGVSHTWYDRLRGVDIYLTSTGTNTEQPATASVTAYTNQGITLGVDAAIGQVNTSGWATINHFFRRAPGVFDVVCYTGTGVAGQIVNHGLSAVPELIIVKIRNTTSAWYTWHTAIGLNNRLQLNQSTTVEFGTNDFSAATSTSFTAGSTNTAYAGNLVAYLFATKAGISKVFSFTGNGTSQNIDCGFTTGSRFILIKRTDSTGDWYIWDSVRGITSGNDPHLSLNTTAAEVTTDDTIDPFSQGFTVNQLSATNVNVSGATYIGLAIA